MFAIFKCKIFRGGTFCKWLLIATLHTGRYIWPVKSVKQKENVTHSCQCKFFALHL